MELEIKRLQRLVDEYRDAYSQNGCHLDLQAMRSFEFAIKCVKLGKKRHHAIAELFDRGLGYEVVGRVAGVGESTIRKWVRRVKAEPPQRPYREADTFEPLEYHRLNKMHDFLQLLGETQ